MFKTGVPVKFNKSERTVRIWGFTPDKVYILGQPGGYNPRYCFAVTADDGRSVDHLILAEGPW